MSKGNKRLFCWLNAIVLVLAVVLIEAVEDDDDDDKPDGKMPEPFKPFQKLIFPPEIEFHKVILTTTNNITAQYISTNPQDIRFYIYGKANVPDKKKAIDADDETSPADANYDEEKGLLLLIHGFESNPDNEFPKLLKEEFHKTKKYFDKYNIVIVNWAKLANAKDKENRFLVLPFVALSAQVVGPQIAKLLTVLLKQKLLKTLDDVYIIGFGVGAQIGAMGIKLARRADKTLGKAGRLTALDPASSFYTLLGSVDLNIDINQVKFIDVYHTDSGRIGLLHPVGHVDFYPNGGSLQPGCNTTEINGRGKPACITGWCSHAKAHKYFLETFSKTDVVGCKCPSLLDKPCIEQCKESAIFGLNCRPDSTPGSYYLRIGSDVEEIPLTV